MSKRFRDYIVGIVIYVLGVVLSRGAHARGQVGLLVSEDSSAGAWIFGKDHSAPSTFCGQCVGLRSS
jgi:hypothetical protein